MSTAMVDKAARLIATGRVRRLSAPTISFMVQGDTGNYAVTVLHTRGDDGRWIASCTCRAGQEGKLCCHALAARREAQQEWGP